MLVGKKLINVYKLTKFDLCIILWQFVRYLVSFKPDFGGCLRKTLAAASVKLSGQSYTEAAAVWFERDYAELSLIQTA